MADNIDHANELNELFLKESLSKISTKTVAYSGFCLACGDECGQKRFCDSYCRTEYEKKNRMRK